MELVLKSLVSLHLIDENFLLTDDIKEKYSWKSKYEVKHYPSADRFISDINKIPLSVKGTHIVILAVHLAKPDKQLTVEIINRIIGHLPGIDIIKICHEKELANETCPRNGNIIRITNNENTLLRIDNAIKWVLAKTNFDYKYRFYNIILYSFLTSLIITLAASLVYYFT
jgi:hypothetical protein